MLRIDLSHALRAQKPEEIGLPPSVVFAHRPRELADAIEIPPPPIEVVPFRVFPDARLDQICTGSRQRFVPWQFGQDRVIRVQDCVVKFPSLGFCRFRCVMRFKRFFVLRFKINSFSAFLPLGGKGGNVLVFVKYRF
jgi:hypothetical protein